MNTKESEWVSTHIEGGVLTKEGGEPLFLKEGFAYEAILVGRTLPIRIHLYEKRVYALIQNRGMFWMEEIPLEYLEAVKPLDECLVPIRSIDDYLRAPNACEDYVKTDIYYPDDSLPRFATLAYDVVYRWLVPVAVVGLILYYYFL